MRDALNVAKWADENAAIGIVVGMPYNMDGGKGAQARLTEKFVAQLRLKTTIPVEIWDERLSSFQADEWLDDAQVPARARAKHR